MIDFSAFKALIIPEGDVKTISINSVIEWQKEIVEPLPYLQFNADMVFDTNVVCDQNTKIEIEFTREDSGSRYLYGVRSSGNTASVTAYLATSGAWRFGNTYRNFTLSRGVSNIHSMTVSKAGYLLNGEESKFVGTLKSFTANATLTLGSARTNSGAYSSPTFIGKVYSFKMYDNDSLILDWQPSKAGNKYGFYDKIAERFVKPIEL